MKRILSLMLVLPLAAYAASGCAKKHSSDDGSDDGTGNGDNGGPGGANGGNGPTDPSQVPPEELKKNPIEGVAPAKAVFEAGAFTDGPVWHAKLGVLFFSTPLGEGALYRMLPDGRVMKVRDGSRTEGTTPIGNTINGAGEIVTVEAKRITRTGFDDKNLPLAPAVIATGYPATGGPAPAPNPDPNTPSSVPGQFDTLNDVVAGKDGSLYVTDPGYFANPSANRIYRVAPDGTVAVVEAFEDVPRPNGIALTPDQKGLYVGFSAPQTGTKPFVRRYYVNDDGTLGEHRKFIDVDPPDSEPDGIEVDQAGNLFVATKVGIQVFKADGSKIGVIAVPEIPTAMAFAGKDLKTLYITTQGTKIYQVTVNVPGIVQ